jgi:ribosomal protein L11 methylase PrmA
VATRIQLIEGEPENSLAGQFDTILSNLTCEEIIVLLPVYVRSLAPAGKAICAGILHEKFAVLESALAHHPLQTVDKEITGEWVGLTLRKA